MKSQPFVKRLGFAVKGIGTAIQGEPSFRFQVVAALVAALATAWLRPGWLWAGLIAISIALVLVAELVNTALEHALDGLHPDIAPFVARAKDCAAGAVLVASLLSVALFLFMLLDKAP